MRLTITIFSMLFCFWAIADYGEKELNGFDPSTDIISSEYEAGPYLIYDCESKHWTCVMESFYTECLAKRAFDIDSKAPLRCAGLGKFPNKKSCFQKQLYLVGQNHSDRFCIHSNWKEKEIRF